MVENKSKDQTDNATALRDEARRMLSPELNLLKFEIERMNAHRFSWAGMIVAVLVSGIALWGLFFLQGLGYISIIPIPGKQAGGSANVSVADIVGVFVPALLLVVAFFVGATGLRRLQLYDTEFRESRKERREEVISFQHDIDARFEKLIIQVEEVAKQTLSQEISEFNRAVEKAELKITGVMDELEKIKIDYRWVFDAGNRDALAEGSVSSMGELHSLITDLFNKNKGATAKALVEKYFPADGDTHLRGNDNDFFNTATQLASADLEPLAYRVLKQGLRFFPNNPDLMATGLKHASDAGFPDEAETLLTRMRALPNDEKNWRVWVFVADYLGSTASVEDVSDYYKSYIDRYFGPDGNRLQEAPSDAPDERMFAYFAQYLMRRGRTAEAKKIAILATENINRAPQSAGQLAEIYLEEGDFKNSIIYAKRALKDDRRDQTHVNSSAMLMNIALSKDSLLICDPPNDAQEYLSLMSDVLNAYAAVLRSKKIIGAFYLSIAEQVNALVAEAEAHGINRRDIINIFPPEIETVFTLRPSDGQIRSSDPDDFSNPQAMILAAKEISQMDSSKRSVAIDELVKKIRSTKISGQISKVFSAAADHFDDDPEETEFVIVLRAVAQQL